MCYSINCFVASPIPEYVTLPDNPIDPTSAPRENLGQCESEHSEDHRSDRRI